MEKYFKSENSGKEIIKTGLLIGIAIGLLLMLMIMIALQNFNHCVVIVDGVEYCYVLEDTIVVNEEKKTITFHTKSENEKVAKEHELPYSEYTIESHFMHK